MIPNHDFKIINMILPLYKHCVSILWFYDSRDVLDLFWNLNGVWFTCFGIIFLICSNKRCNTPSLPSWMIDSLKIINWVCRGAFDLPKSESGFEIMILIHRFIWANRKQDFESGGSYSVYDFKWINHPRWRRWRVTPFYLSKSDDSETSKSYSVQLSKRIKYIPWIIELMFVKWQDHVYDFEIVIWNHVSGSGKSNALCARNIQLDPNEMSGRYQICAANYCQIRSAHQKIRQNMFCTLVQFDWAYNVPHCYFIFCHHIYCRVWEVQEM